MTRAKDRDEDMVSIASSNHSRKRKKAVSPPSDSSNSDVPVTKSKNKSKNKLDSDTSTDRQKGKRSSHLTDGAKPSAAKKGKSAKHATTDSDDDSDEDIVVVASSSKASQSTSYKRSSPSKPSYKHRDEKENSLKDRRLSQAASDNDDEMASRTSSHKSAKTTSSKASTPSFSKKSHLSGLSSHKSARDSLKSEQVQLPFRKFSDIFGDHNFAPAKSVSPAKAHNDFHAAETSQDAIKIKRLQGQNETLKRKFDESEDRFNEASSRSEELQAQVKQLEYQIKTMEKRHDENVARVKERFAGSGDTERATQARIEELEHNFSIATNKHVEVTLALHAELNRVQRELDAARGNDIAPRLPAWMRKAEMESTRRADELEAQLKQQKLDFENKIESLESELALQQVNPQLAAKEREIEAVRLAFTRELEKKDDALKTLRTMYNMDRQAWSACGQMTGSSSGLPAFQDVESLQKIVTAQNKQLKDADLRLQAVADTYEARIKQMDHIARELLRKNRRELEDLENSRSSMEFDRSRFQGQVASLKREREQQDSVITELRKFRLDYDRLRAEHPVLQKKYDQLLESKNLVYAENENLKRERLLMHAQDQQRQSKMDEYAALLQAGQLQVATPSDLLEKYKLLKSTYSMEREKYKRKIKKLERKLSIVQGGPVYGHLDGNSLSNGMSATPATSTSEEESSHSQARANRRYSTQKHADLGDTLFNDTISSEVSLRPAKRITPRSPSPFEVLPSKSLAYERLSEQVGMVKQLKKAQLEAYEQAKPSYQFPPTIRERKADTKVPRHHNRVYVRSECHTPYVPDEMVSDSDDEFLEWESQAYAKSQAGNPDRKAAVVNTCWNRHILDIRCNRVRSSNLHFCIEFVESYGPLIHSREATPALLKHILKLVDLGQLTADEGGTVIRSYHQAV